MKMRKKEIILSVLVSMLTFSMGLWYIYNTQDENVFFKLPLFWYLFEYIFVVIAKTFRYMNTKNKNLSLYERLTALGAVMIGLSTLIMSLIKYGIITFFTYSFLSFGFGFYSASLLINMINRRNF
jgi:hypothetical protein